MAAVELVVGVGPEDVAVEVKRRDAAGTEEGVDGLAVGDGGGGGVGVLALLAGGLLVEDFLVPEDLPVSRARAEDVAGDAAVGGAGEEDAVVPDGGGGPAVGGDGGFPGDVFGGGPSGGEVGFGGDALAVGAA